MQKREGKDMQPYREAMIEDWKERYQERCREFINKEISIDVFRASLYSLGFRGEEIECEVSLYSSVKRK